MQEKLTSLYETKVDMQQQSKGKGKIIFTYYNDEDLNRLLELLDYE